jgi:hypothetical protein
MDNLGWIAGAVLLAAAAVIMISLRRGQSGQPVFRVVAVLLLIAGVGLTFVALVAGLTSP